MTNKRTIAKRDERAKAAAGLLFIQGRWVCAKDAARLQSMMDEAAAEAALGGSQRHKGDTP